MSTPTHTGTIYPVGAKVRVTETSASGDSVIDDIAAPAGIYIVESFTDGKDGDDPDGKPYYLLDRPGMDAGGCWWAYPEHVAPTDGANRD